LHIRAYGDCDQVAVSSLKIHQFTLIGGATKDDKFNASWNVSSCMIKDDKVSMNPTANNMSNLCEMIIQVWNAESVVNEMVFSLDERIASMGGRSKIKGMDDCFLDWL